MPILLHVSMYMLKNVALNIISRFTRQRGNFFSIRRHHVKIEIYLCLNISLYKRVVNTPGANYNRAITNQICYSYFYLLQCDYFVDTFYAQTHRINIIPPLLSWQHSGIFLKQHCFCSIFLFLFGPAAVLLLFLKVDSSIEILRSPR